MTFRQAMYIFSFHFFPDILESCCVTSHWPRSRTERDGANLPLHSVALRTVIPERDKDPTPIPHTHAHTVLRPLLVSECNTGML